MYFKTIAIAVMAVNIFEIHCQPLEQGNMIECYSSNGWHDSELNNNKKTCNSKKCFGFFNFPGMVLVGQIPTTFLKDSRHRHF